MLWVNEMLNFGHSEFSDSQKSRSWVKLVSKTKSNLSDGHWHSTVVVLEHLSEVNKHTLSSLWSKITLELSSWTNICLEHKIEWVRFRKFISSIWGFDFELLNAFI